MSQTATTYRRTTDGHWQSVPVGDLVPGDAVIVVEAADGRLTLCEWVKVTEVRGMEIVCADRVDIMLLAGV